MAPRKPDPAERFGGSFFGPESARLGSRLGFAWSRWYPHTKWQDHQPEGPDAFHWFDKELDILDGLGISSHLVLYGWPKWAMDDTNPLPKDMRWKADDPRWEDLKVETAWDRYMKAVAAHHKGRAVVYEIENEPEFDKWDRREDEYAKFTIRSARLLKQADPAARVMVNNVYGIPSGLNRRLLEKGGAKVIDIISWHDYHEGWLADAAAMKRMRAALDDLGGRHVEIWFNEGWAYTNTAVDEPIACTRLTSAQSTNAMVASVAELTAAGQEKTILFHTGYEQHGMSFWDYSGPGTMLWDWYSYPLPLVAAWNTLVHHIGKSERVALVRPAGANFCIFQDLRSARGVMVAYADRDAPADVTLELPLDTLIAEDAMGNTAPLAGRTLVLSKTGRPVFLYDAKRTPGRTLAEKMEPLDRRHESFVSAGGQSYRLPPSWEGKTKGSAEGNPALADGRPVWRLDQVWPPEPAAVANYHPMVWRDGFWVPTANAFGGQPKAEMKDRGIRMEFRARHGDPAAERICGLVFIVPRDGMYEVKGAAELNLWDGNVPVRLTLLHKTPDGAKELAAVKLEKGKRVPLTRMTAKARAGDELVLLPRPDGAFVGGDVTLRDVEIAPAPGAAAVAARSVPRGCGTRRPRPVAGAGIPPVTLHQFRHTCASDLLASGAHVAEVQRVLGHETIATTVR